MEWKHRALYWMVENFELNDFLFFIVWVESLGFIWGLYGSTSIARRVFLWFVSGKEPDLKSQLDMVPPWLVLVWYHLVWLVQGSLALLTVSGSS